MAPNHGGEPLGYTLGPMGSHWGQKNGSKPSKITMSQNSNFWLLRGYRFGQKIYFTVMAPYHGGDPLRSILGPMGSHWGKKWVKTVKNYHDAKFEFSTTPWSSIWAKNRIYGYGAKSRWGAPRVHLGANGVPLGQKMGQNRKKLPCPKIRIFDYSAVIDLGKKSNLQLWRLITVGIP